MLENLTSTVEQNTHLNAGQWSAYQLFGLTLASDFPFVSRLANGAGIPDLTFTCVNESPSNGSWKQAEPAFASPPRTDKGESRLCFYRQSSCNVLHLNGVADFYLWPKRIVCHLLDPTYDYLVEIHLLGGVLSLWLELQGIPALHASAVVVDGQAVAFLASNTGGKSSLAATLMQAGHPLLADDILPLEYLGGRVVGRPGYPQMRMWPDQAQHFLGHIQNLEQVHPALSKRRIPVGSDGLGAFCNMAQPLARIYLPERRQPVDGGTTIEITPVSRGEAVIELIRHSFVVHVVEAIGLRVPRLHFFAGLVRQIPMRRVIYPSGLEHLPRVREAILGDMAKV
jgi:hypothetical protein